MQKRSHILLAQTLAEQFEAFPTRRARLAFVFGSFQPDCNPLSYWKGSLHARILRGHNYDNSRLYIDRRIRRLQQKGVGTLWQYYTLGKLTHYVSDAFTYPHNSSFPASQLAHHPYESALRLHLRQTLPTAPACRIHTREDPAEVLCRLHAAYLSQPSDCRRDAQYILMANRFLLTSLLPAAKSVPVSGSFSQFI